MPVSPDGARNNLAFLSLWALSPGQPRYPQRRRGLRKRAALWALRFVWFATILWYEFGIFVLSPCCDWPKGQVEEWDSASLRTSHILIIADPQVLDRRSYPGRSQLLSYLTQIFVDFHLRKSWLIATRRLKPDLVIFLGDMMDSGRMDMSDKEYTEYFNRFQQTFRLDPPPPVYFLPGNHDVGLGSSPSFSSLARTRYTSHFGPLNQHLSVSNHSIVFIDAPGLVDEDRLRAKLGYTFNQREGLSGTTARFVDQFASAERASPVILFSHIPLFRPRTTNCGPLRERGTVQPGFGMGYQNTLSEYATEFLLRRLRPTLIFSGDDHDYCEYIHSIPSSTTQPSTEAREVTVKSLSIAMGIRKPGYQLLSLSSIFPFDAQNNGQWSNIAQLPLLPPLDQPCILPDQIGIYQWIYLPLAILSVILLLYINVARDNKLHGGYTDDDGHRRETDSLTTRSSPRLPWPRSLQLCGRRVTFWVLKSDPHRPTEILDPERMPMQNRMAYAYDSWRHESLLLRFLWDCLTVAGPALAALYIVNWWLLTT